MINSVYFLLPALAIGLVALFIFDEAIKNENVGKNIYKWLLFSVGFVQGFLIGWFVTGGGLLHSLWIKLLGSIFVGLIWTYQPTRWRRMHKSKNETNKDSK